MYERTSKLHCIKHTPHRIDIDHVETNYALRQQMDLKFEFGAPNSQACISSKNIYWAKRISLSNVAIQDVGGICQIKFAYNKISINLPEVINMFRHEKYYDYKVA